MKPLSSVPVRRGQVVNEWIPASDQSTDAGRADFWKRQQERMKLAQANRTEAGEKVRTLRK